MGTIKTYDGAVHPVSAGWYAQNVAPFPQLIDLPKVLHEARRAELLDLSNERKLTPREEAELQAVTRWMNVNRAWVWLNGRHYREFGFGYLDQVHGNACTHACGCKTQHVFDHIAAQSGQPVQVFPHYLVCSCQTHAPLVRDFKAHFAKVHADNAAKTESK